MALRHDQIPRLRRATIEKGMYPDTWWVLWLSADWFTYNMDERFRHVRWRVEDDCWWDLFELCPTLEQAITKVAQQRAQERKAHGH